MSTADVTAIAILALAAGAIYNSLNVERLRTRIESLERRMEEIAPWLAP